MRLPREMTMEVSKVLRLRRKMQLICWKPCKRNAPVTQTTFDTFADTWECQEVPRLLRKTTLQPALKLSKRRGANTTSTPRPPEWNRNPCYAFGKKSLAWLCLLVAGGSNVSLLAIQVVMCEIMCVQPHGPYMLVGIAVAIMANLPCLGGITKYCTCAEHIPTQPVAKL